MSEENAKEAIQNLEKKPHSPFAGCFLILFTVLVFVGLIVFGVVSGLRQNSAIDEFAATVPLELPAIEFSEEQKALTVDKLEAFANAVKNEEAVSLSLSVEDINHLIFMFPEGEELRTSFRIDSISSDLVESTLTMKLNTLNMPWEEESADRYLNMRLFGAWKLSDGELYMSVDECQSTDLNKKIPEEFVANFDPYRIMLKYKEHKKIAPIMMALTGVRQEAGALILDYQPGAPTPGVEALPDSPLEVSAVRTLLAISVIFTFTLTGFLVWNKMRKKKKNN